MKIIGITGMSGAGKSTFTEMIGKHPKVGIIKVDDLVGEAKKKYFKAFLQPKENNTTEATRENPKLKNSAKKLFFEHRITFWGLMKLRSFLVKPGLQSKIEQYKKEGKELVVVDDWMVGSHKWLKPKLNSLYVVKRKFLDRREGLKIRSALTAEELKVWDLPYAKGFVKNKNASYIIQNNGTLEGLECAAQRVYERYVTPSFDDRYGVKKEDLLPIKSKEKQISPRENTIEKIY